MSIAAAVLWALQAAIMSTAGAQGLWWRLSGDGEEAFLGGSIHVGSEVMYPLPESVMAAFARADVLVVEIDILNTGVLEVLGQLFTHGIYRDGTTLEAHIDPHTWDLLQQTLSRFDVPELLFRWQKPWFAALNLSLLAFREAGYREDLGIDYHFLEAAAASDKPVVELETVEQQLALFSRLSAAEQEMFLHQTLLELEEGPDYLDAIIAAWRAGDAEAMGRLIYQQFEDESPEARHFYRLFIVERNHTMSESIRALLDEGLTPFVVVGAGHLVGDQGLVNLLREPGRRIQPLVPSRGASGETGGP